MYLNTKENRFNPDFIEKIHKCLDEVEAHVGSTALITTSTHKKLFSNGLDLEWVMANPEKGYWMIKNFVKLCARIAIFPIPTIAAINGHVFAGGLMLAMCHDYRYMRKKKGLLCLPEIVLPMPLPPSMTAIMSHKISPHAYNELMFGKRFSPEESEELKIIHQATEPEDLMTIAQMKARELKKKDVDRENL